SEDALKLPDERREERRSVGLEQLAEPLRSRSFVALLDRLGDQSEELEPVVLADATGTTIGHIGLDRLPPGSLGGVGTAGGALEILQNCPGLPERRCVAK